MSPDQKRAERARAVAAYDAMVKARPLKPPPLPREMSRIRTAGALAFEREKRLGLHDRSALWIR